MNVVVYMFSDFRKYLPPGSGRDHCKVQTIPGISVAELLDQLKVGNEKPRVITVNDTNRKEDYILTDGDVVKVFSVAKGG
jgi:sulfur carrier protein ThiS